MKTLDEIILSNPELKSMLPAAARQCVASGVNDEGHPLYSERLVVIAARSMSGDDPFSRGAAKGNGEPGVTYR